MPRVRKGSARTQARKRKLRLTKGYENSKRKLEVQAKLQIVRSGVYSHRDRRARKRDYRRLWITRLNAACRMRGMRYSQFINGAQLAGVLLNRKMLSQIAIEDPMAFDQIIELARKSTTAVPAKNTA